MNKTFEDVYDVIIIGAGPGGLMASWILSLSHVRYITFGFLEDSAAHFTRYPWDIPYVFEEGSEQGNFLERIRNTMDMLGEIIVEKFVVAIYNEYPGLFTVVDEDGYPWLAKKVIMFNGIERSYVKIKNEDIVVYNGVFYHYASTPAYQSKERVGLIGPSEMLTEHAPKYFRSGREVFIFCLDERLSGDPETIALLRLNPHVTIFEGVEPIRINHIDRIMEGFTFKSNSHDVEFTIVLKTLISFPIYLPATPVLHNLGVKYDGAFIHVDENYETNIPGLFAGGDAIGGRMTVLKALQEGTEIAYHIMDLVYMETIKDGDGYDYKKMEEMWNDSQDIVLTPSVSNNFATAIEENPLFKRYYDAYLPIYSDVEHIMCLEPNGKIEVRFRFNNVESLKIIPQLAKLTTYLEGWEIRHVIDYSVTYVKEEERPSIIPIVKVYDSKGNLKGEIQFAYKFGRPERDIIVILTGKYENKVFSELAYFGKYDQKSEEELDTE